MPPRASTPQYRKLSKPKEKPSSRPVSLHVGPGPHAPVCARRRSDALGRAEARQRTRRRWRRRRARLPVLALQRHGLADLVGCARRRRQHEGADCGARHAPLPVLASAAEAVATAHSSAVRRSTRPSIAAAGEGAGAERNQDCERAWCCRRDARRVRKRGRPATRKADSTGAGRARWFESHVSRHAS